MITLQTPRTCAICKTTIEANTPAKSHSRVEGGTNISHLSCYNKMKIRYHQDEILRLQHELVQYGG